jgi:hypothetical protein
LIVVVLAGSLTVPAPSVEIVLVVVHFHLGLDRGTSSRIGIIVRRLIIVVLGLQLSLAFFQLTIVFLHSTFVFVFSVVGSFFRRFLADFDVRFGLGVTAGFLDSARSGSFLLASSFAFFLFLSSSRGFLLASLLFSKTILVLVFLLRASSRSRSRR